MSDITNAQEYPKLDKGLLTAVAPCLIQKHAKIVYLTLSNCTLVHAIVHNIRYYNQCKFRSDREVKYGETIDMIGFSNWPGRFIYAGYIQSANASSHFWYVHHIFINIYFDINFSFLALIIFTRQFINFLYPIYLQEMTLKLLRF